MDRRSPAPSCADLRQADETKAHHAAAVTAHWGERTRFAHRISSTVLRNHIRMIRGFWRLGYGRDARDLDTRCGRDRRDPDPTVPQLRSTLRTANKSPTQPQLVACRPHVARGDLGYSRAVWRWAGSSTAAAWEVCWRGCPKADWGADWGIAATVSGSVNPKTPSDLRRADRI
jgi:hypothetical protein